MSQRILQLPFQQPQEREADPCKLLLTDATVELSLDNTQNNQKKEVAKASSPLPSSDAGASSYRNLSKSYEEVRIALPDCPEAFRLSLAGAHLCTQL